MEEEIDPREVPARAIGWAHTNKPHNRQGAQNGLFYNQHLKPQQINPDKPETNTFEHKPTKLDYVKLYMRRVAEASKHTHTQSQR